MTVEKTIHDELDDVAERIIREAEHSSLRESDHVQYLIETIDGKMREENEEAFDEFSAPHDREDFIESIRDAMNGRLVRETW